MKDVYKGDSKSLSELLITDDLFFIPEYQRMYEWAVEDVQQLFDDVDKGIKSLDTSISKMEREIQCSKFLGCVILWSREFKQIDGTSCDTAKQGYIHEVIDGQQRLSSFLIIFTRFYAALQKLCGDLDQSIEEEVRLLKQLEEYNKKLLVIFTRRSLSHSKCYIPALIRQADDKWDCACSDPNLYSSPVAQYLNLFFTQIKFGNKSLKSVQGIDQALNKIIETIDELIEGKCSHYLFEDLQYKYEDAEVFSDELNPLGEAEVQIFNNTLLSETAKKSVVSISFLHYFMKYCAVTVISSPHESKALDMFQSLNSTGIQLNALQIFKPHISKSYNPGNPFSSQNEFNLFNDIEKWIDANKNEKDNRLKIFFLRFGQVIDGSDVRHFLSTQKNWIINTFTSFSNGPKDFIDLMFYSKEYLNQFVVKPRSQLIANNFANLKLIHTNSSFTVSLSSEAQFCLLFLIDVKHDLAHTLLMIFYIKFRLTQSSQTSISAKDDFEVILKAVTAFFFMWRTSIRSYPDAAYSELLKKHFSISVQDNKDINNISAKHVINKLKTKLNWEIRRKSRNKGTLIQPLLKYGMSAPILRMALLIYSNKSRPMNGSNIGLVEDSSKDHVYIDAASWIDEDLSSVEHVVPQVMEHSANIKYWNASFSNNTDSINSIGNLTLLSQPINSSVGEKTKSKRDYYGSMNTNLMYPTVTKNGTALVSSAGSVSHLLPIYYRLDAWIQDIESNSIRPESSNFEWGIQFINKREENIIERVRHRLMNEWLDF